MDRLDALKSIAAQAGRGELAFPTHVNATLKLQRALSDPDCHVEEAARLVQTEPLLAARTVADWRRRKRSSAADSVALPPANMATANSAALTAPASPMAKVATGTPRGICTIDKIGRAHV